MIDTSKLRLRFAHGTVAVFSGDVQVSPFCSSEADAVMYLHWYRYGSQGGAVDNRAEIYAGMIDASWKQAHGTTASLPVFASEAASVARLVSNRIKNAHMQGSDYAMRPDSTY